MKVIKGYVWMPLHFGCFHGQSSSPYGPVPFEAWMEASRAGHRAALAESDDCWNGCEVYRIEISIPENDADLAELRESRSLILIASHKASPDASALIGPPGDYPENQAFNAPLEYFGENHFRRFRGLPATRAAQQLIAMWDPWWTTRVARIRFKYVMGDACFERQEEWGRRKAARAREKGAPV